MNIFSLLIIFLFYGQITLANTCDDTYLSAKEKAHKAITHDLYHSHYVEGGAFSKNSNRNQIYKVKVYNSRSGRYREAIFKPRYYGDGEGWNRVPMEYVTYEINLLLGMDYIPPISYVRNFKIADKTFSEGALLFYVEDAHSLQKVERKLWDLSKKEFTELDQKLFLSDARILDVLLQNPDRHVENFMRGKHWVDGEYRPLLIDHAANLKERRNHITLLGQDPFQEEGIKIIRKSTYDHLKMLDQSKLEKLNEFISQDEIRFILQKKDEILNYFERLKEKFGESKVIIKSH